MLAKSLRLLRIKAGLSRDQLSDVSGISRDALSSYENGRRKPDFDAIIKLERLFNMKIADIVGGDDSPLHPIKSDKLTRDEYTLLQLFSDANRQAQQSAFAVLKLGQNKKRTETKAADEKDTTPYVLSIPVIGRAAAGMPIEMIEEHDEHINIDADRIRNGDFAIIASGDSMIDVGIKDGDRVVIRPQPTIENGEIALVAVEEGSTIKRVYFSKDSVTLMPANADFEPQHYSVNTNIRILGRIVKVIKNQLDIER